MPRRAVKIIHPEDHGLVDQTAAIAFQLQPRRHHRRAGAALSRLGIAEKKLCGFGEIRGQRHVEQSALPARHHLGHARNGFTSHPIGNHPQSPRPLGHQKAPIGQHGQRPGMFEPVGNRCGRQRPGAALAGFLRHHRHSGDHAGQQYA